jgi:hypothetical protein
MENEVRNALTALGFTPIAATDVSGTGDFLKKIVDLIRGCGFGVAIYSDKTPSKTLGNIFFEIGTCHLLGKPVQLLVAGHQPTPSDFVRTEWVPYDDKDPTASLDKLRAGLTSISASADYYFTLGTLALEAEIADLELAFERLKQAVLITNHVSARARISDIKALLRRDPIRRGRRSLFEQHRVRLLRTISEFERLLPTTA